ncbi:hypothetical protein [Shinella sp. BYT-45]|uniref:hypothetical protein n=1 Tax=Shinella sp. BYT-45 TaxID=3377377 RepID=UPI00397EEAC6
MDSLFTAAARALSAADALAALKRVALRDAPPAPALRGIHIVSSAKLLMRFEMAANVPEKLNIDYL